MDLYQVLSMPKGVFDRCWRNLLERRVRQRRVIVVSPAMIAALTKSTVGLFNPPAAIAEAYEPIRQQIMGAKTFAELYGPALESPLMNDKDRQELREYVTRMDAALTEEERRQPTDRRGASDGTDAAAERLVRADQGGELATGHHPLDTRQG